MVIPWTTVADGRMPNDTEHDWHVTSRIKNPFDWTGDSRRRLECSVEMQVDHYLYTVGKGTTLVA